MNAVDTAALVGVLGWVRTSTDGEATYTDATGVSCPCFLQPGAREGETLLRLARDTTRPVTLLPIPALQGAYLAIDDAALQNLLSEPLETLVNQIAHDVRNYAFTIGLQAEMGLRQLQNHEGKEYFEAVLRQLDGLKLFLDQLLLFGRPATLTLSHFELASFLREQVQHHQFARQPSSQPGSVTVETAADVGNVVWDARLVGIALQALLDNASRSATPPPASVVSARREGTHVTVEVRDCGPGIPAEKLAALEVPMKVRRAGSPGLGLAIVRKIAAAHGGNLSLSSSPAGTTATLLLPREVASG